MTPLCALLASSIGFAAAEDERPAPPSTPPPLVVETTSRVVAIGDLHADLASAREALRLAGAIDEDDRWIGGDLIVVQVGDQLDRGDDGRAILDLLDQLGTQAHAAGGGLYALIGNHELMNVQLDFRYVFDDGWADFTEFAAGADPTDPHLADVPEEHWGRTLAFRPGGPLAMSLAERNVALIINDTLFVHGGILPEHVAYDLETINAEMQAWMRGEGDLPDAAKSAVWDRTYSDEPDDASCALLHDVLRAAGVERMVVAHTVQEQGINAACGGAVWRIDVGLADYYGGETQVLEIVGDEVRVLR